MRPHPQRGQGWRKGGRSYLMKQVFYRTKNLSFQTTFLPGEAQTEAAERLPKGGLAHSIEYFCAMI